MNKWRERTHAKHRKDALKKGDYEQVLTSLKHECLLLAGEVITLGAEGASNAKIRTWYNAFINALEDNWQYIKENAKLSLEEKARIAHEMRHFARVTARNHMLSSEEVENLQKRDLKKYGDPEGPTFAWLIDKQRRKCEQEGREFDINKAYANIIESSTRTDWVYNTMNKYGLLTAYDFVKNALKKSLVVGTIVSAAAVLFKTTAVQKAVGEIINLVHEYRNTTKLQM